MKHALFFLMLSLSIGQQGIAQNTTTDKTFELDPDFAHRRFFIDLGQGNKIKIELTEAEDLIYLQNIDSLLEVFVSDLSFFKDSLANELTIKRVDYRIDSPVIKKIRIQQFQPKGFTY